MTTIFSNGYPIVAWDIARKLPAFVPFGKDGETGRGFKIKLMQNQTAIVPVLETMRLYAEKPDGTHVYIDAVIDNGVFRFDLTTQVFAVIGTVKAHLELNASGKKIFSNDFSILVDANLVDGSIVSSNEYKALEAALATVDNINSLTLEVELARDGSETLGDNVSTIKAKVKDLGTEGNRFVRALGTRLASGYMNACITVLGDSTGNDTNEWVYQSAAWLASKFPKYTFLYKLWNHATQSYNEPITIQTGTGTGILSSIDIPRLAGNYVSSAHRPEQVVSGDIDIAIKLAASDWSTPQALISKFGAAGQRGWLLGTASDGSLYFWYSDDGTANYTVSGTNPALVDGQTKWLRVTFDVDDGASGNVTTFYTSDDGITWTVLGDPIVRAGVTQVFATTAPIEIGSRGGGISENFGGQFFEAIVRNGIEGTIVARPIVNVATDPFTDAQGNTWELNGAAYFKYIDNTVTILNASVPGEVVSYSADDTRFNLQTPLEPQLCFISYSHNEGVNVAYHAPYQALCDKILAKYPNAGIVCVAQNPQSAPEVNIISHAIRCVQVSEVAAKNNFGLIDVFKVFKEFDGYETILNSDGCHPTQLGFEKWTNEVKKFLTPATKIV